MKFIYAIALLSLFGQQAFAEGDAAKGEKAFKKCKACHMIVSADDEVIYKGGKTGPNLYGIIGRVAGTVDGFKYGNGLKDAAAAEFVWTEEEVAEYTADAKKWLDGHGFAAKTKMSFKLKKGGEDVAAYLASVGPAIEPATEDAEEAEATTSSD